MEGIKMSDYTIPTSNTVSTTDTNLLAFGDFNTEPVMTIHPDGRVTVSDKLQPDEAAAKVVEALKTQWLADAQATKIRELQQHITELENRLRVLWDKLEGERKYHLEHLRL
ncbi:hypothetical protein EBT31_02670 [bacterium]|nr:hypothetical protein [bacterium]NBX48640.1 hypothetical protein [bacterium]